MFKKMLALLMFVSSTAIADYRFIVPQEPGGGTSVWASIIARNMEKYLGEKIVIQHIPGARDITGFNKFHNELRKDPKVVMVAHGGNAESYLGEKVDYNYHDYEPIGGMNLTIVTGYRSDLNPYAKDAKIKFAAGSGNNPDIMAFTLLVCGELPTLEAYKKCYNEHMTFVKGMKAPERRLAFLRGELNATRETPAAYIKYVDPLVDKGEVKTWFSHGVLDLKTGRIVADKNYPGKGSLQEVYKQRWGKEPKGPLYDAYILVKMYRDVLQKSLWVDKGNPNALKLKTALVAMINDPEAQKEIEKDSGDYSWLVGQQLSGAVDILQGLTKEQSLKNFVWWQREALGVDSVYKTELVKKK